MKHPSKESLLREFPEAKQERIRELSQIFEAQSPREEAEQFLHDHRLGTSPRSTEKLILRVADWALRGEGVCEIHYGERTPYPLAIYVDMGGLSRKTILYDVKNEEFVLTTVTNWKEKLALGWNKFFHLNTCLCIDCK